MGVYEAVSSRGVFLDRDGVLNRAVLREGRPYPPASVEELVIDAGTPALLQTLRDAGFVLVGVTNQPDVARGRQTKDRVDAINATVRQTLPLDDLRVCWHDDGDACECRKPKPGLLVAAARDHGIDLTRSFMIGDRWSDVLAGARAGCRTVLIGTGYGEAASGAVADAVVSSLAAATDWIVEQLPMESIV